MTLPCPLTGNTFAASISGCPTGNVLVGQDVSLQAISSGAQGSLQYQWRRLNPNAATFPVTNNPLFAFTVGANNLGETLQFEVDVIDQATGLTVTSEVCEFTVLEIQGDCAPMCVRWTQINLGEPLKVFHDKTLWDPTHYLLLNEPDPDAYLITAINTWNSEYQCGNLFELTTNLAEAHITVEYQQGEQDACDFIATALCVCDSESDVCVRQLDHNDYFSVDMKQPIVMYHLNGCGAGTNLTAERWTNTMMHELGHCLGMGHVFNQSYLSIMGNRDNTAVQIYDHDREQLANRHPCGCVMVNPDPNIERLEEPVEYFQTGDWCPCCRDCVI